MREKAFHATVFTWLEFGVFFVAHISWQYLITLLWLHYDTRIAFLSLWAAIAYLSNILSLAI